jgi:hypothetical protein
VVEEHHVAVGRDVVEDLLLLRQMVEGDAQPLDDVLRTVSSRILRRNVLVVDLGMEAALEGLPVHLAECQPQLLDGLLVVFARHAPGLARGEREP